MSETSQTPLADQEDEVSLLDLLQTVVDNLRLIVGGSLGAGVLAFGISFLIPPTFTAKTQFLPPQQQQSSASSLIQSLGSMGGLAGAAAGIKKPIDQYIAFLKSQSVLDAMVDRFKLLERYDVKFRIDARKQLEANTKATGGKDGIIQLEVDDKDPQFAADMANAYVVELKKLMGRLAVTEAQQRRAFFEHKIQEAKTELAEADKALRSTGINASTLKSSPLAAVEVVARLKGAITAQEVKVGSLRGYLTDSAPEIKQALVELGSLRSQLTKAEQDDPVRTGRLEDTYVERYRDYKYKEALYEMFAKQYELARVDEAREGAVIQVVDSAQPPERKSKPQKAMISVIATLAGGLGLLIFVFVRKSVRHVADSDELKAKMVALQTSWRKAFGR